ncbi:MAG: hypothetical protein LJE70_13465 [Chromatiaceae bacterium]|jgi:hypothetical protein|nr:hypothetical protein [Chromatiaceae bacterium]
MIESLSITFEDGITNTWGFDFSAMGTWNVPIHIPPVEFLIHQSWIKLDCHKCPQCTLPSSPTALCPVAVLLAQYALDLKHRSSFEEVDVVVVHSGKRRTELKRQRLPRVVSELVRLAVFQSRCPVGRKLKPAMRRLAPFPSSEEILHALAIFFLIEDAGGDVGKTGDVEMDYLRALHLVFKHLSKRLREIGEGDAAVNGVIVMDAISQLFAVSAPNVIRKTIAEFQGAKSS